MTSIDKLSNDELHIKCYDAFYQIASYWYERKSTFLDEASDEFFAKVAPAVLLQANEPTEQETVLVNTIFTDWMLYEWHESGLYGKYLELFSDKMGWQTKEVLTQIRDTQFFSNFIITGKSPEEGTIDLIDSIDGEKYRVIDRQAAEREDWNDGMLALRIARVGNRWVSIGQSCFHDMNKNLEMATTNSIGMTYMEDTEKVIPTYAFSYERFMRDLIGVDGRYRQPLRIRTF